MIRLQAKIKSVWKECCNVGKSKYIASITNEKTNKKMPIDVFLPDANSSSANAL